VTTYFNGLRSETNLTIHLMQATKKDMKLHLKMTGAGCEIACSV
jgi:hypothetical protein